MDPPSRRDSRRLLIIGALLLSGGIAGSYINPGLENEVETTRGTVASSRFAMGDGGHVSLSRQQMTAVLTVDYVVDGKARRLDESVATVAGIGPQIYGVGAPVTVYIRRSNGVPYATLAKPKPLRLLWVSMAVFGLGWMALGWLVGRPVRRSSA